LFRGKEPQKQLLCSDSAYNFFYKTITTDLSS